MVNLVTETPVVDTCRDSVRMRSLESRIESLKAVITAEHSRRSALEKVCADVARYFARRGRWPGAAAEIYAEREAILDGLRALGFDPDGGGR